MLHLGLILRAQLIGHGPLAAPAPNERTAGFDDRIYHRERRLCRATSAQYARGDCSHMDGHTIHKRERAGGRIKGQRQIGPAQHDGLRGAPSEQNCWPGKGLVADPDGQA
jgi:hypothetical protein